MASHELRKGVSIIIDDNARNELGIGKLLLRHWGALLQATGLQGALRNVQAGGGEPPVGLPPIGGLSPDAAALGGAS